MTLLNAQGNLGNLQDPLRGGSNPLDVALSNQTSQAFQQNGSIPSIHGSTFTGLPSGQIPSELNGRTTRNIAYWFIPEVGIVNMYINPQSISYNLKKLITPERTKGGYVIQYWGEELTTLAIRGHTGSSGVNGLNVLEEVYRAEQYLYDPIALSMAAENSITGLNAAIDSALGNLGGLANAITSATTGVMQLDPASQSILPRNIPSLSSLAMGFRGYFTSFSFTESAERLGLFEYDIQFTVTQRRGYRFNQFGWQHSAIDGPSNWQTNPLSFSGVSQSTNTIPTTQVANNSGRFPFSQ